VTSARATPPELVVAVTLADPRVNVTGTPATPTPSVFRPAANVTCEPAGPLVAPRYRRTVVAGDTGAGWMDTLWGA
jgi:hypothetical protein